MKFYTAHAFGALALDCELTRILESYKTALKAIVQVQQWGGPLRRLMQQKMRVLLQPVDLPGHRLRARVPAEGSAENRH